MGLTVQTAPLKLKVRSKSNLGVEGRGFESLRPDHLTPSLSTSLTE